MMKIDAINEWLTLNVGAFPLAVGCVLLLIYCLVQAVILDKTEKETEGEEKNAR